MHQPAKASSEVFLGAPIRGHATLAGVDQQWPEDGAGDGDRIHRWRSVIVGKSDGYARSGSLRVNCV
jgi:hypothetical protein